MPDIDIKGVIAQLEGSHRRVTVIDANSPEISKVPIQWRAIVDSNDAQQRRLSALDLWNHEFFELIPGYSQALKTKLVDVRVCEFSDAGFTLAYLFDATDSTTLWIGRDPANFRGTEPIFWESIPAPARTFLRQVHAGYTLPDGYARGLTRPEKMITLAEKWSGEDGTPEWLEEIWFPDCEKIDPKRVMYVTQTHDTFEIAVSPELPEGKALTYYDGEANVVDFGEELDDIMLSAI